MGSVKEIVSNSTDELGQKVEENKSEMISVVSQLVDKLTGKDLAITYEFNNLQIDIPKATGPDGKDLGSADWKIYGKVIIFSELNGKTRNQSVNDVVQTQSSKSDESSTNVAASFSCEECGKKFNTRQELKEHTQAH